jgi:hypothetical protein
MQVPNNYDFSGYATKAGVRCTDGRTIMQDAFMHNDGTKVPLVWQHLHGEPSNVLGHALLENRKDGVYAYCYLNGSPNALAAKESIRHGDIDALSIYANSLVEKAKNVIHGTIREVSLVISGANPGAVIDNLVFAHGDGSETEAEDQAIIYFGDLIEVNAAEPVQNDGELVHAAPKTAPPAAAAKDEEDGRTLADIFDTFTEEQKDVVYALIGQVIADGADGSMAQSDIDQQNNIQGEPSNMKQNVFAGTAIQVVDERPQLTHDQFTAMMDDARRIGSFKKAFIAHAGTWGIDNIDVLFPDVAKFDEITWNKRKMEWVGDVFSGIHKVPFSRIKSVTADITPDEARAKGYVTGAQKMEEVFSLLKRVTLPQTVYKKQKLDRDDIYDIVDIDIVAWLTRIKSPRPTSAPSGGMTHCTPFIPNWPPTQPPTTPLMKPFVLAKITPAQGRPIFMAPPMPLPTCCC